MDKQVFFKTLPKFLFLLLGYTTYSQSVSGVVVDAKTKESIAFATVSIGENYGVITNSEGGFKLGVARFKETDSLSFSSMGYEKKQFALKDFKQDTIYLVEQVNQLGSVYLMDKNLSAEEIMEKVNERIPFNYDNSMQQFTTFQRIKRVTEIADYALELEKLNFANKKARKRLNVSADSISRQIKNSKSTTYDDYLSEVAIGQGDSMKINFLEGTKLINKDKHFSMDVFEKAVAGILGRQLESANTFKFKTGIFTLEDSLDFNDKKRTETSAAIASYPVNKVSSLLKSNGFTEASELEFVINPKKYKYYIKNLKEFNGETVFVIPFEPNRGSAKFKGELFVSAESFAVIKAEFALAEGKKMSSINLKLLVGAKYMEDEKSGLIIYQKNGQNKYVPKYIKSQGRENIYLKRDFSLKENTRNKIERIRVRYNLMVNLLESSEVELLFIDNRQISAGDYASFKAKRPKLKIIDTYDPTIWENYNIIAPDKAIREYHF